MRLSARNTVVLPQPDGPMKAEISLRVTSRVTFGDRAEAAVVHLDVAEVEDHLARHPLGGDRRCRRPMP